MFDRGGGEYRIDGELRCPVCEESVETMDEMYDHLRIHDVDPEERPGQTDG